MAFKNISVAALSQIVSGIDHIPGRVIANGKSSAIQVAGLAPFVISDGFDIIETKVRDAYLAAHALLAFWQQNRERFDRLAATT